MTNFVWPVSSGRISSAFGSRSSPTAGASSNHKGIDIAVPVGTNVMSAMAGKVTTVGNSKARGNYIIVDHGNGTETLYQHLSRFKAQRGDTVQAGQTIALSGNTGISTGAHLHFEVRQNGKNVDPQQYAKTATAQAATGAIDNALSGVAGAIESSGITDILKKYWYIIVGGMLIIAIIKK